MKVKPSINRPKTYAKTTYVHMDKYSPRDWDYQSPKHQIKPKFVMGHYKKRIQPPNQAEFPVFKELTKSSTSNNFYKRELKPAIFRSYILSQIATLPGAVKVEENKINDDKHRKDKIKVIKNNNICFRNKMNLIYGSKIAFLPGSKEEEKNKNENNSLKRGKSSENITINKNKNYLIKVNKIRSPDRNRIKRNKKN